MVCFGLREEGLGRTVTANSVPSAAALAVKKTRARGSTKSPTQTWRGRVREGAGNAFLKVRGALLHARMRPNGL